MVRTANVFFCTVQVAAELYKNNTQKTPFELTLCFLLLFGEYLSLYLEALRKGKLLYRFWGPLKNLPPPLYISPFLSLSLSLSLFLSLPLSFSPLPLSLSLSLFLLFSLSLSFSLSLFLFLYLLSPFSLSLSFKNGFRLATTLVCSVHVALPLRFFQSKEGAINWVEDVTGRLFDQGG
jgi:hypothetical protein